MILVTKNGSSLPESLMLAYWYRSAELACLGMQQTVYESLETEGKSYGALVLKYHVTMFQKSCM